MIWIGALYGNLILTVTPAEWDALVDRAEETGSIAFDARTLATDGVLRKLNWMSGSVRD